MSAVIQLRTCSHGRLPAPPKHETAKWSKSAGGIGTSSGKMANAWKRPTTLSRSAPWYAASDDEMMR
ncbi:MAG: hypothetical protein VXX04_05935, partial [Actinomycetota bacterium]|nr:hypothetical protein [Actinomycetota bacterium]